MSVRDRYLVGKLAPRENAQGGIEGLEGPLAEEEVEEPIDPIVPGQHEPGAEFGTATGRVEPESDGSDEIDAASNQSQEIGRASDRGRGCTIVSISGVAV